MARHFFRLTTRFPAKRTTISLTLIDSPDFLKNPSDLQELLDIPEMQTSGKNEFSGASYSMINFIVDFPVLLPQEFTPGFGFELGRVVFLKVEFQLLDEETMRRNEEGENAHHLYKARQTEVLSHRLLRGGTPSKD